MYLLSELRAGNFNYLPIIDEGYAIVKKKPDWLYGVGGEYVKLNNTKRPLISKH
jgi:hypothetical protein